MVAGQQVVISWPGWRCLPGSQLSQAEPLSSPGPSWGGGLLAGPLGCHHPEGARDLLRATRTQPRPEVTEPGQESQPCLDQQGD